jgi:sugar-phosphatase
LWWQIQAWATRPSLRFCSSDILQEIDIFGTIRGMNKAVIFDMDGLLVDSEPLWWQAGVEVLRTVGVNLDDRRLQETMGLRTDVALRHWFSLFPWTGKTVPQIEQEVNVRVIQLIAECAEPLPGVFDVIHLLSEQKIPMGLCSSSPHAVIAAVLSKLDLQSTIQVAYSAEDEPMGKPHPGAYLSCAKQIGVHPHDCIAFEDSLYGAIAAKAAEMKVVAVPSSNDFQSTLFDFCDMQLRSLTEFTASSLARAFCSQPKKTAPEGASIDATNSGG